MKNKLLIKSITVILLLAIAFNSFFYYVFFHFSLIYSRYQSHEWLAHADRASLEMIKLPARNFDKEDVDDVWYNGKLYDVADWKAMNDTIYVWVLPDAQEQALVSKMESHYIASDEYTAHNGKAPVIKSVKRLSPISFFFQPGYPRLRAHGDANTVAIGSKKLLSPPSEVITPPPRPSAPAL